MGGFISGKTKDQKAENQREEAEAERRSKEATDKRAAMGRAAERETARRRADADAKRAEALEAERAREVRAGHAPAAASAAAGARATQARRAEEAEDLRVKLKTLVRQFPKAPPAEVEEVLVTGCHGNEAQAAKLLAPKVSAGVRLFGGPITSSHKSSRTLRRAAGVLCVWDSQLQTTGCTCSCGTNGSP
jgi:hypothetical protein